MSMGKGKKSYAWGTAQEAVYETWGLAVDERVALMAERKYEAPRGVERQQEGASIEGASVAGTSKPRGSLIH